MKTKSEKKLEEAQYFFTEMKKKFRRGKFADFKHNLNAFISSARSVTFVLQKEYKHTKGFNDWYKDIKRKHLNEETPKKFIKLRNASIKKEAIQPLYNDFWLDLPKGGVRIKIDGDEFFDEINRIILTESKKKRKRTKGEIKLYCSLKEFPGINLFDICKQYLQKLEIIVKESLTRFTDTK